LDRVHNRQSACNEGNCDELAALRRDEQHEQDDEQQSEYHCIWDPRETWHANFGGLEARLELDIRGHDEEPNDQQAAADGVKQESQESRRIPVLEADGSESEEHRQDHGI